MTLDCPFNILWQGDCLDLMANIPAKSVDLIISDLPYGTTKNKWDVILPFYELWHHYKRITTDNAAIIIFGDNKFTAKAMLSNEKWHRYNLIWQKTTPTQHLNAKKMPLRDHEDMCVFYNKLPTYNPQKTTGHERKVSTAHHKRNSKKTDNYGEHEYTGYDSTERYPKSVWKFATDRQKSALHATQKPLALIETLVKTYSNPGDVVLDPTMGSNTTGLACLNLERSFYGIEKDKEMFKIAQQRLL